MDKQQLDLGLFRLPIPADDTMIVPELQPLGGFKGPMQQQFELFHKLNPDVYVLIVRIAHALKERGFEQAGISLIFERIRWMYALQTRGEDYKLNNNYRAFYSRLIMYREKDFEGFFRLREQRIEYDPASTPWEEE